MIGRVDGRMEGGRQGEGEAFERKRGEGGVREVDTRRGEGREMESREGGMGEVDTYRGEGKERERLSGKSGRRQGVGEAKAGM